MIVDFSATYRRLHSLYDFLDEDFFRVSSLNSPFSLVETELALEDSYYLHTALTRFVTCYSPRRKIVSRYNQRQQKIYRLNVTCLFDRSNCSNNFNVVFGKRNDTENDQRIFPTNINSSNSQNFRQVRILVEFHPLSRRSATVFLMFSRFNWIRRTSGTA